MDASALPEEIRAHLPGGYEPDDGVWLVLPWDNGTQDCISAVNNWLRLEPPYPVQFEPVVWFGADGVGNWLGWDTSLSQALLWNPHDEEAWWHGSVSELWQFILSGYGQDA